VPVNIISGNNSGVYVHINKYYKYDIRIKIHTSGQKQRH